MTERFRLPTWALLLLLFAQLAGLWVFMQHHQPSISCKDMSKDSAKVSGSIQHSKQCEKKP